MRAMILAAGFGTRLRPLTNTIPKALLPIAGRPLIEYGLLFLKAHGIEEVVINLHHLGEKIRATLGDGSIYGLRISYSPEEPILESGGGIKNAQSFLDGEAFVVLNCDTIIDLDLTAATRGTRKDQSCRDTRIAARPGSCSLRHCGDQCRGTYSPISWPTTRSERTAFTVHVHRLADARTTRLCVYARGEAV